MSNSARRVRPRYEPKLPFSPLRNSEFLSGHWLEHRLPLEDEWNEWRGDAERALRQLTELWRQQRKRVDKYGDEAGLEEGFIQPAMQAIGWKLKYQTILRERGREPDYALFTSDDRLDAALKAGRKSPVFWNHATLVAEAKAWHVSLDRPKGTGAKREYPPEQIERYLDHSHCKYGILTNGRLWRLIPREIGPGKPRFQTYLEVDLPKLLDECGGVLTTDTVIDDFLPFYLLFSPRAFETIAGRPPLIERAVRGSSEYRVGVGEDLKERIFEALRLCIQGFINFAPNKLSSHADLPQCREQSFILLYRLLFIMYAEDRGLLPYRINSTYTINLSLGQLRSDVEDRINKIAEGSNNAYSELTTGIWADLVGLFDLIDRGSGRYGIPPYNGGLFDPNQNSFLSEKKLPDWYITQVIDQLGRAQDPQRPGDLDRVDYRDLAIQHLGSIYEGLLELHPRYASVAMVVVRQQPGSKKIERTIPASRQPPPGFVLTDKQYPPNSVYLETNKGERRSSGSYYTPDYIVDYIVKTTLKPLCEEVDRRLRAEVVEVEEQVKLARGRNRDVYKQRLDMLRADFDDRVLQLRVVDPAMGSGHFLVRACQYLAEEIATNPNALDPHSDNKKGDESTLTYWKRRVVESCIFGVDINPLAVELAKLALWLETVAIDEPLTFLDHHLRTGNSLVGGRVSELGVLPDDLPLHRNAFKDQLEQRLPTLLDPLFAIRQLPSVTSEQIKEKDRLYRKVFQPVSEAFKGVADLWCSTYFAPAKNRVTPQQYEQALQSLQDSRKTAKLSKEAWFREAAEPTRSPHVGCFHWELEFPEVFFDEFGRRGEQGFDAVIGNPPYVRQEQLGVAKLYFAQQYKTFRPTADLYVNFIENGVRLLRDTGLYGMIVSNKWLRASYGRALREFLAHEASIEQIVDFAGLPVFPDATVRTLVLICSRNPKSKTSLRYSPPVSAQDFTAIEMGKKRIQEFVDARGFDIPIAQLSSSGWSLSPTEKHRVVESLERASIPLRKYADCEPLFGVKSGLNKAFIIDRQTRDGLIAENPRSAEIIKPLLAGRDVRRYAVEFKERYLIWTYIGVPIQNYPTIFEHLKRFEAALEKRWDKGEHWWELRACEYYDRFEKPKIIYPDIATGCRFAFDPVGYFGSNTTYMIPVHDVFLLGILNSKVAQFYFKEVCAGLESAGTTYLRFFSQYVELFPICRTTSSNNVEKTRHDRMVDLVERMLSLHNQLAAAKTPSDQTAIQSQIDTTDRQIDQLVYELYGLTEEEVQIVEGATK